MARKSISPSPKALALPHPHPAARITVDDLADLSTVDLLDYFENLLAPYMASPDESESQRVGRYGYTIDRIPDLYAWVARIVALYDQLTDKQRALHGQSSNEYRMARERRDASEAFWSVVKMRYQAASRMVTIQLHEEEERDSMHRQRG